MLPMATKKNCTYIFQNKNTRETDKKEQKNERKDNY